MFFSYRSQSFGKLLVLLPHSQTFPSDAVNDLALHYLAKMKILVVRDIEREDVEFVARVRCTKCLLT